MPKLGPFRFARGESIRELFFWGLILGSFVRMTMTILVPLLNYLTSGGVGGGVTEGKGVESDLY
jgi:hypothetical protein